MFRDEGAFGISYYKNKKQYSDLLQDSLTKYTVFSVNEKKYPKKYEKILNILIEEFNEIDWDLLLVVSTLFEIGEFNVVPLWE